MAKRATAAGTRSAQRKTTPSSQPDLIVTMARQAVSMNRVAEDMDRLAQQNDRSTALGQAFDQRASRAIREVAIIEDYLSIAPCSTVEGAVAQILQIYSWANYAAMGAEKEDKDPLERIERMALSALRLLVDKLKIDIEQFGAAYYLPATDRAKAEEAQS